ncbi:MAG TPA: tetratricopeptide repeat protein [Pyrinomonadaceae bacterium]|nr:tetratricopeptide repeat protein [Pyrinomonadaceae bacterium]
MTPFNSSLRFTHQVRSLLLGLFLGATVAGQCHARSLESLWVTTAEPRNSAQDNKDTPTLELNKSIERELAGNQSHAYSIALKAGQYLRLVVDQRGIDVVVALFGPGGGKIVEVDSPNGTQGPESLSAIADISGTYRLEVRSLEKDVSAGRYEVKIQELRAATTQDNSRVAAERTFMRAELLRVQGTAESLRKSIESYEEVLPLYRVLGDRSGEAIALNNVGAVYDSLGESRKALDYYTQALSLRRTDGDRQGEVATLNHIGGIYSDLGDKQKALEYFMQALPLYRVVGDRRGEAITLNNVGAIYNSLGERSRALDYFRQALLLIRAVGDRQGEVVTLNNIGRIYSDLGEKQSALDYFTQALSITGADTDRVGQAITLNNIGLIYAELGDHAKALEIYHRVLADMHEIKSRFGEAQVLNSIGGIYNRLGDRQKALEYYRQALILFRELRDRGGEANLLANIGLIYSEIGDNQKALDYLNQALPLLRLVRNRSGEAQMLTDIGSIYASLGENQKALSYFEQAISLWRAVGDRSGEAVTLYKIASINRSRGSLIEGKSQIEQALGIIESLRTEIVNPGLRTSYSMSVGGYYELYIDLLMRLHKLQPSMGYDAAALQANERVRARSLLETLQEERADIRLGVDSELLQQERSLRQRLNIKAQRQMQLLSAAHTDQEASAISLEIDALITDLQQVEGNIKQISPRYAALMQPQPITLKEIQHQVVDDDSLLLEYSLGDDGSYLWAVGPNSIDSYELPKRGEIEAVARRVYELLTMRIQDNKTLDRQRSGTSFAYADYEKEASALSEMLLGPVRAKLGTKRLLIVAPGALQVIPFAALPEPAPARPGLKDRSQGKKKVNYDNALAAIQPSFLVINHEIVYLPSASVLLISRSNAKREQPSKTLAVFADPVFERNDPRVRAISKTDRMDKDPDEQGAQGLKMVKDEIGEVGIRIARLPGTRREALSILSFVSPQKSLAALDFQASRRTATSPDLRNYRIVHFATHAFINSVHPELSGIVLSLVDEDGRPQDGFLRAHELFNLNLSAQLVVLSGSETGLGKEIRRGGVPELTYGFMYAGAASVLVSLWSINDFATAELMSRFYQKLLRDDLRPAAALRLAQIEMSKDKKWRAPYYWGAFVLQGEGR